VLASRPLQLLGMCYAIRGNALILLVDISPTHMITPSALGFGVRTVANTTISPKSAFVEEAGALIHEILFCGLCRSKASGAGGSLGLL
jgi:hypothetical protein